MRETPVKEFIPFKTLKKPVNLPSRKSLSQKHLVRRLDTPVKGCYRNKLSLPLKLPSRKSPKNPMKSFPSRKSPKTKRTTGFRLFGGRFLDLREESMEGGMFNFPFFRGRENFRLFSLIGGGRGFSFFPLGVVLWRGWFVPNFRSFFTFFGGRFCIYAIRDSYRGDC